MDRGAFLFLFNLGNYYVHLHGEGISKEVEICIL